MRVKKEYESELEAKGRAFAIKRGWMVMKFVSPGLNAVPDRLHLRTPRTVFIEYKRESKTPTAQQLLRHQELRDHGAEVYWVDNIDQVMEILQ